MASSAWTPERLVSFTAKHGGTGYQDSHDLLADPALDAACIVLPNGCHLVDRLCLLLDARPTDVRAVVGTRFHPQQADDIGVGLIGFAGGAVGVVRAIGYSAGARDDWTEIQGTEGALRVNHTDGLFVGRNDNWEPVLPEPSPLHDALVAEWEAFVPHARGEVPSPVPAEYGRLIVATVLAGMESSATGQVVSVS